MGYGSAPTYDLLPLTRYLPRRSRRSGRVDIAPTVLMGYIRRTPSPDIL